MRGNRVSVFSSCLVPKRSWLLDEVSHINTIDKRRKQFVRERALSDENLYLTTFVFDMREGNLPYSEMTARARQAIREFPGFASDSEIESAPAFVCVRCVFPGMPHQTLRAPDPVFPSCQHDIFTHNVKKSFHSNTTSTLPNSALWQESRYSCILTASADLVEADGENFEMPSSPMVTP